MTRIVCESKVCRGCGVEKPLDDFHRQAAGKFGRRARCRSCSSAEKTAYYALNSARIAIRNRAYKVANPERHREHNKRWIERNPVKTRAHRVVRGAIRAGVLVRPDSCAECGAKGRVHAHHDDYSRPLNVAWLCPKCHALRG